MKRQVTTLCLILLVWLLAIPHARANPVFTGPTVADIPGQTAITGYQKTLFLAANSPENCPITFTIASFPAHGTISQFNNATGSLIYTSDAGWHSTDSFTFHATANTTAVCTATPVTSSNATVSLTVVDHKTTVNGQLLNADGSPRSGKVIWALVQPALSFDGAYITQSSVVSRTLASDGTYTVMLYSTDGLGPNTFYTASYVNGAYQENLGLYRIPSSQNPIGQTTLVANKQTSVATIPIALATAAQMDALANSVNAGMAAAVSAATLAATNAATSAATSATAAAAARDDANAAAVTAHNYDLIINNPGVSIPSQVFGPFPMNRSATISIAGSTCSAIVAATTQTDFVVQYSSNSGGSWTDKATLRYAASGKTCSLISVTQINASSGDWIRVLGPATPDATLSGFGFNIKGTVP